MTIKQLPDLATPDKDAIIPVSYNNADYGLKLGSVFMLLSGYGGTTSASGNLALLGLTGDYDVISVRRTDATSLVVPYLNTSDNVWYAHVTSANASASVVASTSVSLEAVYIPRSAVGGN